jgi:hypothetical protein
MRATRLFSFQDSLKGESMATHEFTPTLEFGCLRDAIRILRAGPSELDTAEVCEVGQHLAWFSGCSLAWYAERKKVAPDDTDSTLLDRLLSLFSRRDDFGGELPVSATDEQGNEFPIQSVDELCDIAESALEPDSEGYAAFPVIQVLSIVIPIIIELLKRRKGDE